MASILSKPQLGKRIASAVFRNPSHFLDQVNQNAKVAAWIRANTGHIPSLPSRNAIYDHIARDFIKGAPIDYLEFGVREGGTMRDWLALNTHPDSRFFGFDTFTGLPESWNDAAKGTFDAGGTIPSIDDPRVTFHKGLFQETLPGFLRQFAPRSRLVINNDSDLYSSTLYTLTMLHPILVPDTIIIFDEFSSPLHEFRALNDYLSAYMQTVRPVAMNSDYAMQAAFIF